MYIDHSTPRADLLSVIYGDGLLLDHFMLKDMDPEDLSDAELLEEIQEWMTIGDECRDC